MQAVTGGDEGRDELSVDSGRERRWRGPGRAAAVRGNGFTSASSAFPRVVVGIDTSLGLESDSRDFPGDAVLACCGTCYGLSWLWLLAVHFLRAQRCRRPWQEGRQQDASGYEISSRMARRLIARYPLPCAMALQTPKAGSRLQVSRFQEKRPTPLGGCNRKHRTGDKVTRTADQSSFRERI